MYHGFPTALCTRLFPNYFDQNIFDLHGKLTHQDQVGRKMHCPGTLPISVLQHCRKAHTVLLAQICKIKAFFRYLKISRVFFHMIGRPCEAFNQWGPLDADAGLNPGGTPEHLCRYDQVTGSYKVNNQAFQKKRLKITARSPSPTWRVRTRRSLSLDSPTEKRYSLSSF